MKEHDRFGLFVVSLIISSFVFIFVATAVYEVNYYLTTTEQLR